MVGRFGFGVSVLAALVLTQAPPPAPPPTTQQTPPPDPNNCQLSGFAPLGFVVKIWHKTAKNTTGHGSLISPSAILTTATNHDWNNVSLYEAIGQNIWNTKTWDTCMQVRAINYSIVHDKCCDPETSQFFNFLIFVLEEPFKVSSDVKYGKQVTPLYPVAFLPLEPMTALLSIIEYNSGKSKVTSCSLPLFTNSEEKKPVITSEKEQEMQGLAYNGTCIPLMCEDEYRDESNGITEEGCKKTYLMRRYGTMMCVEPKDKSRKPKLPPNTKKSSAFYGGAPLLCNSVAFGIVTEVFVREAPKEHPGHFFLVSTFLRVYTWLMRQQQYLSNKQTQISVESWHMPPRYRSSEPVPAYFEEATKNSDVTPRSFGQEGVALGFRHKSSGILAFLALMNIGFVLSDVIV